MSPAFPLPPMLAWTPWQPLRRSWLDRTLPPSPGLYRVRSSGQAQLLYIGQTGRALHQRLRDLHGVYGPEMPYRDPHTVAPALWALRQLHAEEFEVSVSAVEGIAPFRKGVEAYAISQHREDFGVSPALNFGRMPSGYTMSSQRREGRRGHSTSQDDASHLGSVPPRGPLLTAFDGSWGGHAWSPWTAAGTVASQVPAQAVGLYRIRSGVTGGLLYIGQGRLRARLTAHVAKPPSHVQGAIFRLEPELQTSWTVISDLARHQLLELENDLIASSLLVSGQVPAAQFLGEGRGG